MNTVYIIEELGGIAIDGNRQAILAKRTDTAHKLYAFIKICDADKTKVTVWPAKKDFSDFSNGIPFDCTLQIDKSFDTLSINDILTTS